MRSRLGARGHQGQQVVSTHLNQASAEVEARANQEPQEIRELREAAHNALVSEAVSLLTYVRAQERLGQIASDVADAGARISDLEASRAEARAEARAEQDKTKADLAELGWKHRAELNKKVRSLARRMTTLADSISQKRKRIRELEAEVEVLAALTRPETPALLALRDALTD